MTHLCSWQGETEPKRVSHNGEGTTQYSDLRVVVESLGDTSFFATLLTAPSKMTIIASYYTNTTLKELN